LVKVNAKSLQSILVKYILITLCIEEINDLWNVLKDENKIRSKPLEMWQRPQIVTNKSRSKKYSKNWMNVNNYRMTKVNVQMIFNDESH